MPTAWGMAAAVVAVSAVLGAPAGIASADKSAEQTIGELQTQGYTVNIDRLGSGPISDCVVTGVRNPQEVTQWVPVAGPVLGGGGGNRDRNILVETTVSKSISVSLDCTG